ncbi:MAG: hypothetical protein II632_09330 [Bacteroidales bacterium]|jgi:hypothetical protein|nr:hypothetical protein [Bacteroidales bacterium]MBQ3979035.1 hypothetical protein [Bacteroidales bacterium]
MKDLVLRILLVLALATAFSFGANAQFKEEAFSQSYNNPADTLASRDSVDQMWTFKEFFHGVAKHDSTLKIGSMFAGSTVFIGAEQFYNKQYWKIPVIYAGIGTGIGMGIKYNKQYKASKRAYDAAYEADPETTLTIDQDARRMSNYMFAAAGLIYWGGLMDGVVNYKRDVKNQAGKATIYSILLPGLGQAYNGEFWKIPIYWGAMIGSYHYWSTNNTNYKRYKRIHNEATAEDSTYEGLIPAERALYYRNAFRRFRDYSMVALVGSYLLQVIDANVFSYMQDFEVNDDLSMRVGPAVIPQNNEYALLGNSALGLKVGFTF